MATHTQIPRIKVTSWESLDLDGTYQCLEDLTSSIRSIVRERGHGDDAPIRFNSVGYDGGYLLEFQVTRDESDSEYKKRCYKIRAELKGREQSMITKLQERDSLRKRLEVLDSELQGS